MEVGNVMSFVTSDAEAFPFNTALRISARTIFFFSAVVGRTFCTASSVNAVFQNFISATFAFSNGSPLYRDFPIYPRASSVGIVFVISFPWFSRVDTNVPSMYIYRLVPSDTTVIDV